MNDPIETKITLKSDKPVGVSSRAHGSNIDAIAFNLNYIAQKDPVLATTLLQAYKQASALSGDDPAHPDEDYGLALDRLKNL